jgi:lipopolysaccharide export system protein LptA
MSESRPLAQCVLLLFMLTMLLQGSALGQGSRVIILENADSLIGKIVDGERARELIGNVRFRQENVRVSCDRALQYLETGKVILDGNMVVKDDSVVMRAPRGVYHREQKRAEAFENVRLDDGTVKLTSGYGQYYVDQRRADFHTNVTVRDPGSFVRSDFLTYYRDNKRSIATGNVKVVTTTDNITITGGQLEHLSERQYSRVSEDPVLVKFDTTTSGRIDTLVVRSLTMELYRETPKRFLAIDSVEIVRSELAGRGGFAEFFTEGDSIHFRKSPVLWYEDTQVTGDSMNVYLKEHRLHRIEVTGTSFAASQSDSMYKARIDQMSGETLLMLFGEDGLSRIDVDVRATSLYHLYEDSVGNGLNKTSGDRITMMFEKGKVKSIKVFGGVEGQYIPENMVFQRESQYALPGLLWRTDRPKLRPSDFRRISTLSIR